MEANDFFSTPQRSLSVKDILFTYLRKWPLFFLCLLLCVSAGIVYIRYSVPKFIASTAFLINGTEGGNQNSEDIIESALNGKRELNLNNEMLLVSSASLMQRTVAGNGFNVSYYKKGRILNIDVYNDSPLKLIENQPGDSSNTYTLYIKTIDAGGGYYLLGAENSKKIYNFRWDIPFTINGQSFILQKKNNFRITDDVYIVRYQPISVAAAKLSDALTVKAYDTKASVIQITIKTENLQKGKDILNALFNEFNQTDIEGRKKLSESTVQFIDERLLTISGELKGVEGNLENYQGNNQLVDIKGQSTRSLDNTNGVSNTIKSLSIQKGIVLMIQGYLNSPENDSKLVPSSLGLNDPTLSSLITQYNDLQIKKERETPLVAPNSTVMQDLKTQVESLKSSILENLASINKNLQFQEENFREQNNQNRSFLSSIPHNERVLQEIKRKQNITEGLYLYLLQKREEAAISSTASNVPHYTQIDPATGFGPVEPNSRNIILYTSLLGVFLSLGLIYIGSLLNDKINTKEDIVQYLSFPFIGQISHISKKEKKDLVVLEQSIAGEEFRTIRTDLAYLLKGKVAKNILVTSCVTNEGKSFISLNLAAAIAMPGKKVALLEFDIRKSAFDNSAKGITDFLAGKTQDLSELYYVYAEIPTLHIYRTGSAAAYPADLLQSENVARLFSSLTDYDYVVIDSPPTEYVSDAFVLEAFSNITVFVIRHRLTIKKQLGYIRELGVSGKLKNIALVLNDARDTKKVNYYGYKESYIKKT